MKKNDLCIIYFALLILLFITSCDNSKKAFQQAEEIGATEAYEKFIKDFPKSKMLEKAKNRIKDIDLWKKIGKSQTVGLYKNYIDSFPGGLYISEAKHRLQMIADYDASKSVDIIKAYHNFLKKYPTNVFSETIQKRLEELQPIDKDFQALNTKEKDIEVLRSSLKKFQNTGYVKIVQERLDKISVEKYNVLTTENDIDILRIYLKECKGTVGEKLMIDRLEKMALSEFKPFETETDLKKLQSFVKKYKETTYGKQIETRLEKLAMLRAEKIVLSRNNYKGLPTTLSSLLEYIEKNHRAKNLMLAKQAHEDIIIEQIELIGIGSRFTIKELQPEFNGHTGSIAARQSGSNPQAYFITSLYPKDKVLIMPMGFGFGSLRFLEPYGANSIWRFIGNINFKNYTFKGNRNEPLCFMFLSYYGFVYLHGKGSVINKDGEVVFFKQATHAILSVRSNVYNDTVYIDAKNYGSTRVDVRLPLGKHELQVEKTGYLPYTKVIDLQKNTTVKAKLEHILSEQDAHAILTVRSNVYKDTVYIDGKNYGSTRVDAKLPFGKHELQVKKKGYLSYKKVIDFQKATTIKVKLKRNRRR